MRRQIKLANELFEIALPNIRNATKVADDPRILIFKKAEAESLEGAHKLTVFALKK
jgi:hypothetical protein